MSSCQVGQNSGGEHVQTPETGSSRLVQRVEGDPVWPEHRLPGEKCPEGATFEAKKQTQMSVHVPSTHQKYVKVVNQATKLLGKACSTCPL